MSRASEHWQRHSASRDCAAKGRARIRPPAGLCGCAYNFGLVLILETNARSRTCSRCAALLVEISPTIAAIEGDLRAMTIIPHTFRNTTLGAYQPGPK